MAAAINVLAERAARVQSRRNLSRSLSPKLDHSHSITRFDRSRTGPKAKPETWHPVFSGRPVAEPRLLFLVSGNVGDHALLERDLLDLTRHIAQVDQHAVDLGHPHERVPIQQAR